MILAELAITAAREQVIDFTFPFGENSVVAAYRGDVQHSELFSVFHPLQVRLN